MEVSGGFDNTSRQQLRNVLDRVVVAARRDVHDFSGGHLNEVNLYKPPEVANHKSWKSAKKPSIKLAARAAPPPVETTSPRREVMKGTLVNFSFGTTGNFPMPHPPGKSQDSPTKSKNRSRESTPRSSKSGERFDENGRKSTSGSGRKSSAQSYLDDGVLVEELNLPEMMLRRMADRTERRRQPHDVSLSMQHDFLSGHIGAVTKKDQFLRLKKFEAGVIGKQDASERNVMQGLGAVEQMETKLKQEIHGLEHDAYGPNFHRLQVYSTIFEDVVDKSRTFGFILRTIKREYDAYIASLLDEPTGEHRILYDQVNQLASHPSANPELLGLEQERVNDLEQEAREMLEENERLRQAVRDEMNRPIEPEPEPPSVAAAKPEGAVVQDIVTTVENLRANILEKLDAVQALRTTLRTEYVPSTVCTHLEQCIKETEVEIQRLMSNTNYFEGNINEMEKDLQDAIENADTTERDQRRVWKRISAVKTGGKSADSDDEQDETCKWDWYIS